MAQNTLKNFFDPSSVKLQAPKVEEATLLPGIFAFICSCLLFIVLATGT